MDEASKRAVAAESLDDAAALIEAMRSKDGPGIDAVIQFTRHRRPATSAAAGPPARQRQ